MRTIILLIYFGLSGTWHVLRDDDPPELFYFEMFHVCFEYDLDDVVDGFWKGC